MHDVRHCQIQTLAPCGNSQIHFSDTFSRSSLLLGPLNLVEKQGWFHNNFRAPTTKFKFYVRNCQIFSKKYKKLIDIGCIYKILEMHFL